MRLITIMLMMIKSLFACTGTSFGVNYIHYFYLNMINNIKSANTAFEIVSAYSSYCYWLHCLKLRLNGFYFLTGHLPSSDFFRASLLLLITNGIDFFLCIFSCNYSLSHFCLNSSFSIFVF